MTHIMILLILKKSAAVNPVIATVTDIPLPLNPPAPQATPAQAVTVCRMEAQALH